MRLLRSIWLPPFVAFVAAAASCGPRPTPPAAPESAAPPTDGAAGDENPAEDGSATAEAEPAVDEREALQIEAISRAVNERAEQIQACYKRATAERLDVDGRVVLRIELGEGGAVAGVTTDIDEPGSTELTTCLVALYSQHEFPPIFDPGDSIMLPLSFVAAFEQFTVSRAHVTPRKVAPGLTATVILDGDSTGNEAAAVTHLELGPNFEVPMHTHTSVEVLYFGAGGGRVWGARGERRGTPVAAQSAVYIAPGVPHAFRAGAEGAKALQLYAPAGPEQRFEGRDAAGTTPVTEAERKKLARKRGVGRPVVATLGEAKTYSIAGGKASVAFLFDPAGTGDTGAYLGVLSIENGTKVPEHTHDRSTELLYVLEGTGTMTVGDQSYDVAPAMAIQVPAFRRHSFTASSTVRVLQYYAPAGPEQRFVPKPER